MRKSFVSFLIACATCLAGCGDDGDRVPAVGTVTLDGKPLSDVYVTFRPDDGEAGVGGFAVTDAEGRFEIYYPDTGKGLIPARYKVTVNPPPQVKSAEGRPSANPMAPESGGAKYPPVYGSPEDTPLRVTVTADGAPLKVELSSNVGVAGKR